MYIVGQVAEQVDVQALEAVPSPHVVMPYGHQGLGCDIARAVWVELGLLL